MRLLASDAAPDTAISPVRLDERDVETEHGGGGEVPANERAGHGQARAKPPRHIPTLPTHRRTLERNGRGAPLFKTSPGPEGSCQRVQPSRVRGCDRGAIMTGDPLVVRCPAATDRIFIARLTRDRRASAQAGALKGASSIAAPFKYLRRRCELISLGDDLPVIDRSEAGNGNGAISFPGRPCRRYNCQRYKGRSLQDDT
jgi:hypothetical protein